MLNPLCFLRSPLAVWGYVPKASQGKGAPRILPCLWINWWQELKSDLFTDCEHGTHHWGIKERFLWNFVRVYSNMMLEKYGIARSNWETWTWPLVAVVVIILTAFLLYIVGGVYQWVDWWWPVASSISLRASSFRHLLLKRRGTFSVSYNDTQSAPDPGCWSPVMFPGL